MLLVVHYAVYLARYAPVEAFYLRSRLEVYDTVAEKVERLFAYLLRVVPVFKHGACRELVPNF